MDRKLLKFTENRSYEDAKAIYDQRIIDAKTIFEKFSDNFITRNCPVCDNSLYKNLDSFMDRYGIVECEACKTKYVNPCPNFEALQYYYENCECNRMLQKIFSARSEKKNFQVDDRVLVVEKIINDKFKTKRTIKILEVGCGVGSTLKKIKDYCIRKFSYIDFDFTGIDVDSNAIKNSVDESLNLISTSAEQFCKLQNHNQSFNIIIHFELIEHLIDPYQFLVGLKNICSDDGIIYFTTPNENSLEMGVEYNEFRPLAHSIFPPMHLTAFSSLNILYFIKRAGFDLYELTTPGKLDLSILEMIENPQNKILKEIKDLNEYTKYLIQKLLNKLNVSGHMAVIVEKST